MDKRARIEEVLRKDLEVSELVENRLQETYGLIKGEKEGRKHMKKRYLGKIAATAAMVGVIGTLGVGTAFAVNGVPDEVKKFFGIPIGVEEMFGDTTNQSVEKHTIQVDNNKGGVTEVDVPAVEYVPLDEELASELFDGYVSEEAVVRQIGEHTLTVWNYVTDGQAFCAYMTLEREGGVTAMVGSSYLNIDNGMRFAEDSDFYFQFIGENNTVAAAKMYFDEERSTEETYYIRAYGLFDEETKTPMIQYTTYPGPRDYYSAWEYMGTTMCIHLPEVKTLEKREIVVDGKTVVTYSCISMKFDTHIVLDAPDKGSNIDNIEYIEIVYKDGSSYIVYAKNEWDNQGYCVGGLNGEYSCTFNRLVNIDQVKQIKINDKCYDVE